MLISTRYKSINPSNLCYLLSIIQSVFGGRNTTEYGRAVKRVCRWHSRHISSKVAWQNLSSHRISTSGKHTLVYLYNNINLQNTSDDI